MRIVQRVLTLTLLILNEAVMGDLVYLLGTVAFFALMLGYVALCERLGRPAAEVIASL